MGRNLESGECKSKKMQSCGREAEASIKGGSSLLEAELQFSDLHVMCCSYRSSLADKRTATINPKKCSKLQPV
ncbi:hypothetical protein F2Q69_00015250 [Brassica cretica]|uniref:Uncharacterized protein n=1 Tax=Brassica cretica TaxID=69181 RepID=A0A8S9R0Z1_BRACR|nr:hypothetical protein F2Q69_00015250 [Brassica cretica]